MFENGIVEMRPDDPSASLTIRAVDAEQPQFDTAVKDGWPESNHQAMLIRWKQFLRMVTDDEWEPSGIISGLEVTQMVKRIYETGGRQ